MIIYPRTRLPFIVFRCIYINHNVTNTTWCEHCTSILLLCTFRRYSIIIDDDDDGNVNNDDSTRVHPNTTCVLFRKCRIVCGNRFRIDTLFRTVYKQIKNIIREPTLCCIGAVQAAMIFTSPAYDQYVETQKRINRMFSRVLLLYNLCSASTHTFEVCAEAKRRRTVVGTVVVGNTTRTCVCASYYNYQLV